MGLRCHISNFTFSLKVKCGNHSIPSLCKVLAIALRRTGRCQGAAQMGRKSLWLRPKSWTIEWTMDFSISSSFSPSKELCKNRGPKKKKKLYSRKKYINEIISNYIYRICFEWLQIKKINSRTFYKKKKKKNRGPEGAQASSSIRWI